jgi:hypothetical protein
MTQSCDPTWKNSWANGKNELRQNWVTSAETETVEQRVMAGACSLLRKYDKTQCADFDPIDANVGALDSRIIKHDTELANLKASIEILSKGLVAWSEPFPQSATLFGDAFDAPPSLSLLRL